MAMARKAKGLAMETSLAAEAPIACSLDAGKFKERLGWIAQLNRSALVGARREGLRLTLIYRRTHAESVREMVRRERQCCGFLGFDLKESESGVTLVIEAPDAAADALDAVFDPFLPDAQQSRGCACTATTGGKGDDDAGC